MNLRFLCLSKENETKEKTPYPDEFFRSNLKFGFKLRAFLEIKKLNLGPEASGFSSAPAGPLLQMQIVAFTSRSSADKDNKTRGLLPKVFGLVSPLVANQEFTTLA